jgi:16S rRNA (cytosine1402-N4)-methyltransferase
MNKPDQPISHFPVLLDETLEALDLHPGNVVVDATLGLGGHSEKILEKILPGGHLIAFDQDSAALEKAKLRLKKYHDNITFIHANFNQLQDEIARLNRGSVDKILFDLGVSSLQLQEADRGFSFSKNGPLDMRMDRSLKITAADLVNELSSGELADIFVTLGEEKPYLARKLADAITLERKQRPITNTSELSELAGRILHRRDKIHPATRIFMGLRIAVNNELGVLKEALGQAFNVLAPEGIMAVISFHSLEDRIVKEEFKALKTEGTARLLNSHVIKPGRTEVLANPPSRSAKLRVLQKLAI